MDLLFKRYASPFLLLDSMIQACGFYDFVIELLTVTNEDMIYEVWLHKVYDKSFVDFKNSMMTSVNTRNVSDEELVTTIQDSKSILDGFIPV